MDTEPKIEDRVTVENRINATLARIGRASMTWDQLRRFVECNGIPWWIEELSLSPERRTELIALCPLRLRPSGAP